MARVDPSGIVFAVGNVLTSKRQIIPLGTAWSFHQTTAPTGWAKVTTHNNTALRVVGPGNGGGSGGAISFTSAFPNSTKPISAPVSGSNGVNGYAVSIPQIASHNHGNGGSISLSGVPAAFNPDGSFAGWNGGDVGRAGGWNRTAGGTSGGQGGGAGHSHSASSGSYSFSGSIDLRIRYIDVILCKFS